MLHEGLIAFSNYHYYENNLNTFPSAQAKTNGVTLVKCSGVYDRGKSCTNKIEAQAIVSEIVRRLSNPKLSQKSIGVITFNMAQQRLIENLLDEARLRNPKIESYFDDNTAEPVFIKNLENVQGDERDVILFSICYAPDLNNAMTMNFGPLNRDGGERRLNVAVTRAKEEVIVFSSLSSDRINLSSTRARGVAHLKAYLEYAEKGMRTLASSITSAGLSDYDSIFEKEVANFLREKGYEIHTQVGCSGYKIDIALVCESGKYLVGIECDGAMYHSAATARDRDKLRQSVLEGLGWRIIRAWSTDWWRNREASEEKLLMQIKHFSDEEKSLEESIKNDVTETVTVNEIFNPIDSYKEAEKVKFEPQERFYKPETIREISDEIRRIVLVESPMTENLLARRIAEEWDFNRIGVKIIKTIQAATPNDIKIIDTKFGNVYCNKDFDELKYKQFRIPNENSGKRSADEITFFEIKNAIEHFSNQNISADDIPACVSKIFGYSRSSKDIERMVSSIGNE